MKHFFSTPRAIKSLAGLTLGEFDTLLSTFHKAWLAAEKARPVLRTGARRQRSLGAGRNSFSFCSGSRFIPLRRHGILLWNEPATSLCLGSSAAHFTTLGSIPADLHDSPAMAPLFLLLITNQAQYLPTMETFSGVSSKYSQAIAQGDLALARAAVKEAAEHAGYRFGPVFHGTDTEFTEFKFTEDIGFHFGSKEAAATRVQQAGIETPIMVEAFLKIQKPFRVDDLYTWSPDSVLSVLVERQLLTPDDADNMDIVGREEVKAALSVGGYDGIVYENATEFGGDSFIVFESSQIRDARTIVYGDDGRPLSLEQRFLANSPDIRGDTAHCLAGLVAPRAEPQRRGRNGL